MSRQNPELRKSVVAPLEEDDDDVDRGLRPNSGGKGGVLKKKAAWGGADEQTPIEGVKGWKNQDDAARKAAATLGGGLSPRGPGMAGGGLGSVPGKGLPGHARRMELMARIREEALGEEEGDFIHTAAPPPPMAIPPPGGGCRIGGLSADSRGGSGVGSGGGMMNSDS